jgi:hypothetical protein
MFIFAMQSLALVKSAAASPAAPHALFFGFTDTQVEALATVVIAVLTFAYVLVATFQLLAMGAALRQTRISNDSTKESNRTAAESLELSKRAWVMPQLAPDSPVQTSRGEGLKVYVVNYGGLPADVKKTAHGIRAIPAPFEPIEPDQRDDRSSIVPPGPAQSFFLFRVPDYTAEADDINDPRKYLVFVVHLIYTDLFKKERETMVQWYWHPKDERWYIIPGFGRMT